MSEAFYQKFLSLFIGFLILIFTVLSATEFLFYYSSTGNILFYWSYCGVLVFVLIYGIKYYVMFRDFRETLAQGLYFPNSNNQKPHEPISKPLELEVKDLPLKACLYYRNGYSFKQIAYKLRLGRESQTAKRLVVKGLDILLEEHNIKKVEPK